MILNIINVIIEYINNMINLLDNISFMISLLAFVLSLISFIYSRKDKNIEHSYSLAMENFEKEKENIRKLERKNDRLENRLVQINTLKPYFSIRSNNRDFDTCTILGDIRLKFGIDLINIGKDTAVNVKITPYDSYNLLYFKNKIEDENKSVLEINLVDNYAKVGDITKIRFTKDILDSDREKQFIKFKIKYNDLIGNLYIQEFKFGYVNKMFGGFEKGCESYPPRIVKYALSDYSDLVFEDLI